MTLDESPTATGSSRGVSFAATDANGLAVHLQGEQDAASLDELGEVLARAIALDDRSVIVDLSRVQFLSMATVGVIVRARNFLESRGRSLQIRSPSECARRTLVVCGASELLDAEPSDHPTTDEAPALASWVPVARCGEHEAAVAPEPKVPVREGP